MAPVSEVIASVIGREAELAVLRAGVVAEGRALVLSGEPGIGKTTLWGAGVALARERGLRVLSARASSAEAQLSFAGLIDLCDGIDLGALPGVPGPQRAALEVALLRVKPAARPGEPHAIALGLLNGLRALAAGGPLLVAIDDVQWLDAASADALAFAARRLGSDPVAFLLAERSGPPSPVERALERSAVERLDLGPLSLGATRHLLAQRLGLTVSRPVLRRLLDSTRGNPLLILEVGRLLAEHGAPAIGESFPVPGAVEELLGRRVMSLPRAVRRALLAVALGGDLRMAQLAALADVRAVDDGLDARVLQAHGDRVGAAHPLFAAAVKERSRASERRELHLALAAAVADEELRALHLALATGHADPRLADTVAAAAGHASARGARQQAVSLAEHALRLTPPDAPARTERLLALGEHLERAGESQRITDLLTPALPSVPPGRLRARAWLLLAEGAHVQTLDAFRQHLERALVESRDDPVLRAYVVASSSSAVIGVERIGEAQAQALDLLPIARADPDVERTVLFALAWARSLRGLPIDDVCARFDDACGTPAHMSHSPDRVAGQRLVWRGELAQARATLTRLLTIADERGEAGSYAFYRLHLCELALRAGGWDEASHLLDEWAESAEREFLLPPMYERCRALLAAGRGHADEAERWAHAAIERAQAIGVQWDWLEALRARGIARLLAHEPAGAVESLRTVWQHTRREGVDEPAAFPVAPEMVEGLAELGALDEARAVTKTLRELAERQEHPWALASAKRCAALVALAADRSRADAAVSLIDAAADYERLGLPFDAARSLLSAGRAQRRCRQWAAARDSLQQAVTRFQDLGSPGWAEQARTELSQVGGRRPRASEDLTPTERRVAELAAGGQANKEIARSLFVSVNTVETHLSHAYAKLGVRSRGQLAHRLPGARSQT